MDRAGVGKMNTSGSDHPATPYSRSSTYTRASIRVSFNVAGVRGKMLRANSRKEAVAYSSLPVELWERVTHNGVTIYAGCHRLILFRI